MARFGEAPSNRHQARRVIFGVPSAPLLGLWTAHRARRMRSRAELCESAPLAVRGHGGHLSFFPRRTARGDGPARSDRRVAVLVPVPLSRPPLRRGDRGRTSSRRCRDALADRPLSKHLVHSDPSFHDLLSFPSSERGAWQADYRPKGHPPGVVPPVPTVSNAHRLTARDPPVKSVLSRSIGEPCLGPLGPRLYPPPKLECSGSQLLWLPVVEALAAGPSAFFPSAHPLPDHRHGHPLMRPTRTTRAGTRSRRTRKASSSKPEGHREGWRRGR